MLDYRTDNDNNVNYSAAKRSTIIKNYKSILFIKVQKIQCRCIYSKYPLPSTTDELNSIFVLRSTKQFY